MLTLAVNGLAQLGCEFLVVDFTLPPSPSTHIVPKVSNIRVLCFCASLPALRVVVGAAAPAKARRGALLPAHGCAVPGPRVACLAFEGVADVFFGFSERSRSINGVLVVIKSVVKIDV